MFFCASLEIHLVVKNLKMRKKCRFRVSYVESVTAGAHLVQFRVPKSLLDTERLALARKIYGSVMPAYVNKGVIGPSPSLTVYAMDKIPGITYIEVPSTKLRCTSWQ